MASLFIAYEYLLHVNVENLNYIICAIVLLVCHKSSVSVSKYLGLLVIKEENYFPYFMNLASKIL